MRDEWVGRVIVVVLLLAGSGLFLTGFRFLNPLDTAFRLIVGAIAVAGSVSYLRHHHHA
jgi:hypothetical protein